MNELEQNRLVANDICEGYAEPDQWVSIHDLEEIRCELRFWHKATFLDRGVVALAWQDDGGTKSVAARLN